MIITAKDIVKSFQIKGQEKTVVLNGLNISIESGEFTALVGPSGVGKSTLLYLLGTLDKPDTGYISVNINLSSKVITQMDDVELSKLRNSTLGFIFQFHQLLPEFTALENVMIPAMINGINKNRAKEKALNLIERVGMSHRILNKPMELSGGEQQRIAIARALINDPIIILADEPTGNLDGRNSEQVLNLISEIRKEYNLTFLVATHSTEVASYADRICTLGDGKIVNDVRKK